MMNILQLALLIFDGGEQIVQRLTVLQRAQAWGVGRGDINRNIARVGIDFIHTDQIVIFPLLYRRIFILADINAQHAVKMGFFDVLYKVIHAKVIEAHAVN